MNLLNSVVLLLLIAIIWTGVIYFSVKRIIGNQDKKDKKMLLGGFFLFIGMIFIIVAGTVAFEYIESPEFCGTFCHVMNPYYDSYLQPGNNSMMAVHVADNIICSNCHDEPGIIGKIGGLLSAIPEAYYYYTNTYNPDNLGGEFSREACLKCHDNSIANIPGYVTTFVGSSVNPHSDEKKCTECHNFHYAGLGLSETSCSVCHGTTLDNFEEMILNHGETAGTDCMSCHDRVHPDNALISFTEDPALITTDFCSDCHAGNVERLSIGEHESSSCLECHNEHRVLSIDYKNCDDSCHIIPLEHNINIANCSVCHDLTTIHLQPGFDLGDLFSDIICSMCHDEINSLYESTFTVESLEIYGNNGCIDCHFEHKAMSYPHKETSPFDDCASCHSTYNEVGTIHNRTGISYLGFSGITNDFCSDCHAGELKRLRIELHNTWECIACHSEHLILKIDFTTCESCHESPSDHDTSLTSCTDPTCHEDMRAIHSEN